MTDDRVRITPEVIADLRTRLATDHVDDLAYEGRDHDSEACERCVGERLLIQHASALIDAAGRCGHAVFMRAFVESQNDILNDTVRHWQEQYARERDAWQARHDQAVELVNVAVARAERAEAALATQLPVVTCARGLVHHWGHNFDIHGRMALEEKVNALNAAERVGIADKEIATIEEAPNPGISPRDDCGHGHFWGLNCRDCETEKEPS